MNIGIFCSANNGISRDYFELTAELGRWCAQNGHSIVFGGCSMGLMGCVADAFSRGVKDVKEAKKAWGAKAVQGVKGVKDDSPASELTAEADVRNPQLIGVVPRIIEQGGRTSEHLTVHIPCDNLSDRKDLMLAQSDAVVALPGGIGTIDEVFTVAAAHTIGYHRKPVVLYNMLGFWDSLVGLLDDLQQRGMIRGHWTDYISVVSSTEELALLLEKLRH